MVKVLQFTENLDRVTKEYEGKTEYRVHQSIDQLLLSKVIKKISIPSLLLR